MAFFVHVMFISILYKFGPRVIYFSFSSVFSFVWSGFAWLGSLSSSLCCTAHSSCKFLRLFRFVVFLHSSCSVVVSYFMFIPVFILLFSVTACFMRVQWLETSKACATIILYSNTRTVQIAEFPEISHLITNITALSPVM